MRLSGGTAEDRIGEVEGVAGSEGLVAALANPIGCRTVAGLARLVCGNCQAAFENVASGMSAIFPTLRSSASSRTALSPWFAAAVLTNRSRGWSCAQTMPRKSRPRSGGGLFRNRVAGTRETRRARTPTRGSAQRHAGERRTSRFQDAAGRGRRRRARVDASRDRACLRP